MWLGVWGRAWGVGGEWGVWGGSGDKNTMDADISFLQKLQPPLAKTHPIPRTPPRPQPRPRPACPILSGHLPCIISNVVLSPALWGRRLKMPALSAQGEGTCPNYTDIPARSQPEVSQGQTACSLFPWWALLGGSRDSGPWATLGEAQPGQARRHLLGAGSVATARTRPGQPGCGPGLGEASGGCLPGALGGAGGQY